MNDASAFRPVLDAWFDFQCPDCHTAQSDLRALHEQYGDALEIRLRHFPLERAASHACPPSRLRP